MSYCDVSEQFPVDSMSALRVTQKWVSIEILTEEFAAATGFGFVATVVVKVNDGKIPRLLHISAKSLANYLVDMRADNNNRLAGLKFDLRKASEDKRAPYELK